MKDLAHSHSTAIAAMGITLESGPKTCSRTEFGLEGLQCCSPPICYTENFWELGAWMTSHAPTRLPQSLVLLADVEFAQKLYFLEGAEPLQDAPQTVSCVKSNDDI